MLTLHTEKSKERGGKSQAIKHIQLANKVNNNLTFVHATTVSFYNNYSCAIADALTKPLILGWNLKGIKRINYILADSNMNFITNIRKTNELS